MKLNLSNNQIVSRIAYTEYVTECLNEGIIIIPMPFEYWDKNTANDVKRKYLKKYITEEKVGV